MDAIRHGARLLRAAFLAFGTGFSPAFAQDAPEQAQAGGAATQPAVPPRIATSVFAEIPRFQGFRIAPDGLHLLARVQSGSGDRLVVVDLTNAAPPKFFDMPPKTELAWYRWAGNDRILISVARSVPWVNGEDARETRLVAYDIKSASGRFIGKKEEGLSGDHIVYVDPSGEWLLLSIQRTIYDYPSVYRFDLTSGKAQEVVRAKDSVWDWYADNKGVVRMGVGYLSKSYKVYYRANERDDFHVVAKPKIDDENSVFDLVRIYQDSDDGYVLSNERTGRYALYKFNLATRELGEMVYEHPINDIDDFDTTEDGTGLLYAAWTDDRQRIHWFDQDLSALQEVIDGSLKGRVNWMTSWSKDKGVIMVWTGANNDPGRYYLFVPDAGKMTRYFVPHEKLKPADLASAQPISYKARDGVDIPAYLTLPKGRVAKDLPLVILPHGGPFQVRDDMSFNTEVQFLANRGYAVLQPNFRGSGGYGKAFSDKGYGQWGRAMQDDLDDGMDMLVKQGIVDPKRVCIVGSSYGGYAALWGAIRNPERYRCAASFAGVTDLKKQLAYDLDFFIAKKYQGDWRDKVRGAGDFDMAAVSPVQQAGRLTVPVLIVHGEEDTNVPFKQAKWMVDALKKAGKDFEFHSYPDEGHGFDKPEDMKDWLDRLDAFLAKHNPS